MLSHIYKIYIPSTIDVNNSVDNSDAVKDCLTFLSGKFGGATAQNCNGAWISPAAGLVLENVTICYAFTNFWNFLKSRRAVLDYAKKVRDEMRQDAVSVEIDGKLYFI